MKRQPAMHNILTNGHSCRPSFTAAEEIGGSLHLAMITNCIIVVDSQRGKVERQADVESERGIFSQEKPRLLYKDIGNENTKDSYKIILYFVYNRRFAFIIQLEDIYYIYS